MERPTSNLMTLKFSLFQYTIKYCTGQSLEFKEPKSILQNFKNYMLNIFTHGHSKYKEHCTNCFIESISRMCQGCKMNFCSGCTVCQNCRI